MSHTAMQIGRLEDAIRLRSQVGVCKHWTLADGTHEKHG